MDGIATQDAGGLGLILSIDFNQLLFLLCISSREGQVRPDIRENTYKLSGGSSDLISLQASDAGDCDFFFSPGPPDCD